MFLKKNNKKKVIVFFLTLLIVSVTIFQIKSIRLGNIDQELRIILKQPVLFSTYLTPQKNLDHLFLAISNFLKMKKFDKISVDIPFKNFLILKEDRLKAKKKGILRNPKKVGANIVWKNKIYPAEIRLKGDYNDHIEYNKQWSLKINLKKNKTINNFNEFSLTSHSARAYPDSFVNNKFLEKLGIITPKLSTIEVEVNGDDWGLMVMEEGLSDIFLEVRNKKSVPIFKLTNEEHMTVSSKIEKDKKFLLENNLNIDQVLRNFTHWQGILEVGTYNENKIFKKSNIPNEKTNLDLYSKIQTINNYLILKKQNNENLNIIEKKNLLNFFDIKKFAIMIASNLFWGEVHSAYNINSRFYIDPYTQKINPIPTDFHYIQATLGLSKNEVLELNEKGLKNSNFFSPMAEIYKFIINTNEFKKEYILALKIIEDNLEFLFNEIDSFCKPYGEICKKDNPIYGFSIDEFKREILIANLKFLKHFGKKVFVSIDMETKILFPNLSKNTLNHYLKIIDKKVFLRLFDDGNLELFNLTPAKIFINQLEVYNSRKCVKKKCGNDKITFKPLKKIILNKSGNFLTNIDLNLDKNFSNDTFLNKVNIKNYDLVKIYFKDDYSNKVDSLEFYIEDFKFSKKNIIKEKFNLPIFLIKKNKKYLIKEGNYDVNKKIVLPKGFDLIIQAGTHLNFSQESYIYLQEGSLIINGNKNKNVYLSSKSNNWRGLFVSNCRELSKINYTNFNNLNYFKHENIQLTGGINFHNCPVNILNSNFNNSYSEDTLNIINSNFILNNINFTNSFSDAIDLDFSNGNLSKINLSNIGGDAIDTSGSRVIMKDIIISNVFDKSVSAGEKSNLFLDNVEIHDTSIGIASKDSSIVQGKNIKIYNSSNYDFAAFRKKNFYKGGQIILENVLYGNKTLIQKNSFALINEKKINVKKFDSKSLYSK